MKNTTIIRSVAALGIVLATAPALAEKPSPRVDLGHRFEVRIHNSVQRGGKKPKGVSNFVVGFHLENGKSADSVAVTFSQKGKTLATATCAPKKSKYATRCESGVIPSSKIKTKLPVAIRFAYEDSTTDATSELLSLELAVQGTRNWVGNKGSRPQHVEQRHLRMDGALGIFLLEDSADAASYVRKDAAYLRLWYWDARMDHAKGKWSLRCRIDEGEWQGFKIGRPSPAHGPETIIENRVYQKKTRGAETERLVYQRLAFNANMPFSVFGARPLDAPKNVDGAWTCQLRKRTDAGKTVEREISFVVEGNVAQPHAAQQSFYVGTKRISTTVSFGDAKLPAFDPTQIAHPYGIKAPVEGLVSGKLPKKKVTPRFRR